MSRKNKKNSFLVYHDWEQHCDYLEPEEFVQLWRALFAWHRGETIRFENRVLTAAWVGILPALQINAEKYEEICQRNATNGAKGGRPRNEDKNPVGSFETDNNPKNPIIDNRKQEIENWEQEIVNIQLAKVNKQKLTAKWKQTTGNHLTWDTFEDDINSNKFIDASAKKYFLDSYQTIKLSKMSEEMKGTQFTALCEEVREYLKNLEK